MTLLQLNKEYMDLMRKADEAEGRREAVSIIHQATRLAETIAILEDEHYSSHGTRLGYHY
jgi:hypothetical protein